MILSRRLAMGLLALAPAAARPTLALSAPADTIRLWPNGVPDAGASLPVETMVERSTAPGRLDRAVHGIADPRMVMFRPDRPDGSAALICPGGGYRRVVIDREGFELATWLAARGVTAFVLFYRLPAEGWTSGADTALIDAQRAIRTIRANAIPFGIDPARVAVVGFSAGGHLAADLGARFAASLRPPVDTVDHLSAQPDIVAPIYPVIALQGQLAHAGSREKLIGAKASSAKARAHNPAANVPADAPPHFLVHANDDTSVPPGNSLLLRRALRDRGIPVQLHLFESSGHGFGLAHGLPASAWPDLFLAYLSAQRLERFSPPQNRWGIAKARDF